MPQALSQAYPLQKTAYRHANGGSGAPGIQDTAFSHSKSLREEDVRPKVLERVSVQFDATCLGSGNVGLRVRPSRHLKMHTCSADSPRYPDVKDG